MRSVVNTNKLNDIEMAICGFIVPINANILKDDETGLQYYKETSNAQTTVTIYGLSDSSYSGNVIIPEKIDGYIVTKIDSGAFRDSNITSIIFEKQENIAGIGMAAFYNSSNLTEITIPKNVKIILPYTFNGCTSLNYDNSNNDPKELKIPKGVVTIGMFAFSGTEWESVTIPDSVTKINAYAFYGCNKLTNVTIPDSVTEIGGAAFVSTALTEVTVPLGVKIIGDYAFGHCNNLNLVKFMLKAEALEDLKDYSKAIFEGCPNNLDVRVLSDSINFYLEWLIDNNNVIVNSIK